MENILIDGQIDFSGGMNTEINPILLQGNQYAYMRNGELRKGIPTTRRGFAKVLNSTKTGTFRGGEVITDPSNGQKFFIYVIGNEYLLWNYGSDVVSLTPPTVEISATSEPVNFIQAFNKVFIQRGDGSEVWCFDISTRVIRKICYVWDSKICSVSLEGSVLTIQLDDAVSWNVGDAIKNNIKMNTWDEPTDEEEKAAKEAGDQEIRQMTEDEKLEWNLWDDIPEDDKNDWINKVDKDWNALSDEDKEDWSGDENKYAEDRYNKSKYEEYKTAREAAEIIISEIVDTTTFIAIIKTSDYTFSFDKTQVGAQDSSDMDRFEMWEIGDPVSNDNKQDGDEIPKSSIGRYLGGRLWIATNYDTVFISDILNPTIFDYAQNSFQVNAGDGGKITQIIGHQENNIIIFKEKAVYLLSNIYSNVNQQTLTVVDVSNGCIAPNTALAAGQDIIYLGRRGINTLTQTIQNKLQMMDIPFSAAIQSEIDNMNWGCAANCQAICFNNYLYFAYPAADSAINNKILVYSFLNRTWMSVWNVPTFIEGIRRFFTMPKNDGKDRLFCMDNHGNIFSVATNPYFDDNGISGGIRRTEDIEFEFVTRAYSYQNPYSEKTLAKTQINMGVRNSRITASAKVTNTVFEDAEICEDTTYSYLTFSVKSKDQIWIDSNAKNNFNNPFRNNYAPVYLSKNPPFTDAEKGIVIGAEGLVIDATQVQKLDINNRLYGPAFSFSIISDKGSVEVQSIATTAKQKVLGRGD